MPEHVTERVLLAFDQIHHRGGNGLFAFERRHAWTLAQRHSALIDIGHFGGLHRFIAPTVIDHEQTFVADHLVFIEHLFGARKIALRIDVLNVDLTFGRVLILRQQALHVPGDRCVRRKENSDAHFAFDCFEEAFRFVGERVFLVSRKVPAFVMLEAKRIHHRREEKNKHDLKKDIHPDLEAVNLFRLGLLLLVGHRHSLHLRDWNA